MEKNDWREELQEIIEEEETDMGRPMIPRYAKGYAKLVLEEFISSEIEKDRKKLVSDINNTLKESIENNESVSKVIEKIDIKVFDVDESSTIRIDMINMVDKEIEKAEERGRREVLVKIKEIFETNIPHGLYSPSETSYLYERFGSAIQQYYIDELSKLKDNK